MSVNLTENAIPAIIGGDVNAKPLVQVLDVALVSNINNSQQQRYKLLLSDAVLSKQALLATQLNDRVRTGRVQKGSVVQLLHYICTPIKNRKIIVILNMETIIPDCEIIGNPKPYMDSDLPSVGTKADNTVENLPRSNNNNNSAAQNASHNAQNFRPTIQPPYQPPPYKGRGAILKNEAPARIIPIAALNPYQGLGRSDKPDWITVRAAISFIKTDTFCYTACPLMIGDRQCNKKVTLLTFYVTKLIILKD
ncbi:replication protein A 70 kDa DNA-binding subunit A [Cajanus cajan]|uniref:replication protein A 70 kDa DNA-binding subunit A n=1 Tax=Cajanus cajan TaxID=3821 RepID=UPI00098D9DAB|nr:replication protein A 70 kDa DNA-binding subunit A [Cajanus cajan]